MKTAIGNNPYCKYCTQNECHHCQIQAELELLHELETDKPRPQPRARTPETHARAQNNNQKSFTATNKNPISPKDKPETHPKKKAKQQ